MACIYFGINCNEARLKKKKEGNFEKISTQNLYRTLILNLTTANNVRIDCQNVTWNEVCKKKVANDASNANKIV
jgi:hypothetical protein